MGRHLITSVWWFGLISLSLCLVNPAAAQVDQQRAEAYFKEASHHLSTRRGATLGGLFVASEWFSPPLDANTRHEPASPDRGAATWVRECADRVGWLALG